MNEPLEGIHSTTDGLWRWLLGGLLGGGAILGLLIAAYAIGYHRGQHHHARTRASATSTAATPTTTAAPTSSTPSPAPAPGPVQATPALVARGKALYSTDGCSACHSLTGTAGAGPSFKGVAGSKVMLETGQTITADDAYLQQSIASPDVQIVKGFRAGVMPAAIANYNLGGKLDDVRALVAFIKSQK
jgi:cytochrome c551/c552